MAATAVALKKAKLTEGDLFAEQPELIRVRPILKWAGGKTRLLPALRKFVPRGFNRYFEPFLGGAAFFFDLLPDNALLCDSNPELINCYEVVRDKPEELLETLSQLRINKSEFYRLRELQPERLSQVFRAARLIYLNKTCFNGLYRVNKQGKFNTPYGRHSSINLADPANLVAASKALKRARLFCSDFATMLKRAKTKDFIYLDPPYVPTGRFSDFKRYTKAQFYEADQERLAQAFSDLAERGCFVLLSNSLNPKTTKLYSRFHQRVVKMPRFVNCKGEGRGHVDELLISSYEPLVG